MLKAKVRTFSGCVCEQEVYYLHDVRGMAALREGREPRIRFATDEEREQHRRLISRRRHARIVNENFSPLSLYSTLTFNSNCEVHTFAEARIIRDNYVRRLQYKFPQARICIYMGRGKHTARIHLHMLSDGIPCEVITGKWIYGDIVSCEHLREHNFYAGKDYGRDYTGLANYLFDHWTAEQGGHRYKATRTMRKPEREAPVEVVRNYTCAKAPKAPEGYILVEAKARKFGGMYYKYVLADGLQPQITGRRWRYIDDDDDE